MISNSSTVVVYTASKGKGIEKSSKVHSIRSSDTIASSRDDENSFILLVEPLYFVESNLNLHEYIGQRISPTRVCMALAALFAIPYDQVYLEPLVCATRMLVSCKYEWTDVLYILALAGVQFHKSMSKLSVTDSKERCYMLSLQLFLAHSWLQDETCPLRIWHTYVFKNYCSLPTLGGALWKLFLIQEFSLDHEETKVTSVARYLADSGKTNI
eukprot:GHVL01019441.1.p1 GENE.GHVL01019441.1~~GHVL01019441.1.p1  ORF type:complete len:213 (+),score=30.00 GHVL01019441.1:107-745(+)